jgi:hypothetical protein
MSHLRPEARPRHKISSCKKGHHNYGEMQMIGGGITRQVCQTCADVTIDLTAVDHMAEAQPQGRRPTLANFFR